MQYATEAHAARALAGIRTWEASIALRHYIALARPSHWVKNLLVLPGALAAAMLGLTPASWSSLLLALVATSLTASANYVMNEWLDAASDAYHPSKKLRPAVLGQVTLAGVTLEYLALAALGLAVGLYVSVPMFVSLALLLLSGMAYNVRPVRLKDIPYLDILSESVNNALRLLIGWFAVSSAFLPPASLVLGYWAAGAFLMSVKRFAEYRTIGDDTRIRYRKSFARYTPHSLLAMTLLCAMSSSFFIGVFLVKYRFEYLLAMPLLWGVFAWYLASALKDESVAERPEKLWKQTGLLLLIAALFGLLVLLTFVDIPGVERLSDSRLLEVGEVFGD